MTTYTLQPGPGRVIEVDGRPALRLALYVDGGGSAALPDCEADALARRFVSLLNWREAMERLKDDPS